MGDLEDRRPQSRVESPEVLTPGRIQVHHAGGVVIHEDPRHLAYRETGRADDLHGGTILEADHTRRSLRGFISDHGSRDSVDAPRDVTAGGLQVERRVHSHTNRVGVRPDLYGLVTVHDGSAVRFCGACGGQQDGRRHQRPEADWEVLL